MQNQLEREIERSPTAPLLPIEVKLVAWSLGLGAVLLAVVDRICPVAG